MTSHQNHCENLTASKSSSSRSNCRFQIHSQSLHVIQQYYQLGKRHTQKRRAERVACTGKWETHTITTGKSYGGEATLRRPTRKLENNIKMYLQDVWRDGVDSGFTRSKDRTKNLQLPQKSTYFETQHIKQMFHFLSSFVSTNSATAATAPINPLKTKYKASCLYNYSFSPYRAVNTPRLGYKYQPVNAV